MFSSKRGTLIYACAVSLLVAVMIGLIWHTAYAADQTTAPKADRSAAVSLQNAFVSTADQVKPSVVFITAEHTTTTSEGPDLRGMFPGFPFDMPGPRGGEKQRATASGSGVIVRSDGYVMTNDHVVTGADRVTVRLSDGREFVGKVTEDPTSDIAIVKIDAKGLPAAQLGDSDKVKVGQWAIAVGSPFGLTNTVTIGVVSALTREAAVQDASLPKGGRYYPDLIQTDASINPGNSGGPLVNIDGEVMGINTMIESPTGANAGIGFAVPINSAKIVMDQLMTTGKVVRGYLGLMPEDVTPAKAKTLEVDKGALVASVDDDTPAGKAGIKPMDVIVEINGKKIDSALALRRTVSASKPGSKCSIVLVREGKKQTVQVTVGEAPTNSASSGDNEKTKIGLSVAALTPSMAEQLGVDVDTPGVVVKSVDPDSAAGHANPPIRAGDIILKVNRELTKTPAQFNNAVSKLKSGDTALVLIQRQKATAIAEMPID